MTSVLDSFGQAVNIWLDCTRSDHMTFGPSFAFLKEFCVCQWHSLVPLVLSVSVCCHTELVSVYITFPILLLAICQ